MSISCPYPYDDHSDRITKVSEVAAASVTKSYGATAKSAAEHWSGRPWTPRWKVGWSMSRYPRNVHAVFSFPPRYRPRGWGWVITRPQDVRRFGAANGGLMLLGTLIAAVALFSAPQSEQIPWFYYWCGLPACIMASLYVVLQSFRRARHDEKQVKLDEYLRNEIRPMWQELYYCRRHDLVFDPGTGESCRPEGMIPFLLRRVEQPDFDR